MRLRSPNGPISVMLVNKGEEDSRTSFKRIHEKFPLKVIILLFRRLGHIC